MKGRTKEQQRERRRRRRSGREERRHVKTSSLYAPGSLNLKRRRARVYEFCMRERCIVRESVNRVTTVCKYVRKTYSYFAPSQNIALLLLLLLW